MSLVTTMNQQGLLGDKKREGRCSVVHFGKCLYESKRICGRLLDRNVANKTVTVQLWNAFRREFLIDRKIFNKSCKA